MIIEIFIIILGVLVFVLAMENVKQQGTIKSNKTRIKRLEDHVDNLYSNYLDSIGREVKNE